MGASFADTIAGHTLELDLTKSTARTKKESLVTLCTDIFLIIIRMRESENLGEPAALRKLIGHYIELFRKNCHAMNTDAAVVGDAIYALVALLDETVMSVPGECRNLWVVNPMQLELFNDNLAGEEFFRKLEKLMSNPEKMQEVLEIYYICLSLGFLGKYRISNPAERDTIIETVARILLKTGNRTMAGLSPHGKRRLSKDIFKQSRRSVLPIWVVGLVLAMMVGAWWVVMYWLSDQSVARVLSVLK